MTVKMEIPDLHILNANELQNIITYLTAIKMTVEGRHTAVERVMEDRRNNDLGQVEVNVSSTHLETGVITKHGRVTGFDPIDEKLEVSKYTDIETNSIVVPISNIPVDLDIEGLPWDGRIHSSNKTKTKNGAWKLARNISDADAAKVKLELRRVMGVPATMPQPPLAVAPPATALANLDQYKNFVVKLLKLQKDGTLIPTDINGVILKSIGLTNIIELQHRPDLIHAADQKTDEVVLKRSAGLMEITEELYDEGDDE